MSYVTYLVVKKKWEDLQSMDAIITRNMVIQCVLLFYFTILGALRRKYVHHKESQAEAATSNELQGEEYEAETASEYLKKCDRQVDRRLLLLFLLVIVPSFLLTVGGSYCTSLRRYRKRMTADCSNDESNSFNLNTARIMRRAEHFMVLANVWLMVGFTIWSLRNIFTILALFHYDCMDDRDTGDRYWLVNFYIWTLLGYAISLMTILVIPGAALFQCYRVTERSNETNPYQAARQVGAREARSLQDLSYSNALFDQHALASRRKLQKLSEQSMTLEELRQKVVDILVRKTYPRVQIKANFEQVLLDAFDGHETDTQQLSQIKQLLHKNPALCDVCKMQIKFNHIVSTVTSHDRKKTASSTS